MDQLWRDVKLACRRLRAAPGVTVFSVITLALGIGITAGAYSVVYTGLWRPLGLADESRLAIISRTNMMRPGPTLLSWAEFEHLSREQRSFSGLAAWLELGSALAGSERAELVSFELVSSDYFQTLGIRAAKGRTLDTNDDRPAAKKVAVLSDATWRDQFNADPAIIGKIVKLADRPFEVVGIAPPDFRGVNPQAFSTRAAWVPLGYVTELASSYSHLFDPNGRDFRVLSAVGRLRPDLTMKQGADDVAGVAERLDAVAPLPPYTNSPKATPVPRNRLWTTGFVRDAEQMSADGSELSRLVVVLPGLVLLIACTNLANLVLSRGVTRRHDFAVRRALGASRWRLIREQLTEQSIVAALGGLAGLGITHALVRYAAGVARETMAPFMRSSRIDWSLDAGVVQATLAAVLLSLVVSGLVPAIHLTRDSLRAVMDQGGSQTTRRWRGRGNLIALQVGVSVGLFLVAVIFVRVLLTELPKSGVAAAPSLRSVAVVAIPFNSQQRDETRARATLQRVFDDPQLRAGADAVAVTTSLPFKFLRMGGYQSVFLTPIDRPFTAKYEGRFVSPIAASPSVFSILETPIRYGRGFDERDAADAPRVVILNEGLALDVFGVADVAGRELLMRTVDYLRPTEPRIERVTIAGVSAGGTALDRGRRRDPRFYTPFAQQYSPNVAFLARSSAGAAPVELLREAIRRADPELAVEFSASADVLAVGPLAFAPYLAVLLTSMALLALILAMAGLYGVLSHVVARRTREMGIRIALGAASGRVARLVLRDGFRPIVEGLFIGLATATIVRVFMKSSLSLDIAPIDPVAFGLTVVLIVVAGAVACYLPARRASRVDPNVALRDW